MTLEAPKLVNFAKFVKMAFLMTVGEIAKNPSPLTRFFS